MKKIITLSALALMALTAGATDYTDRLSVSLGGMPIGNQETTISVDAQDNGKYTLSLNNFQLAGLGGIGNIVLADVDATEKSGMTTLAADQVIKITEGDDPDVQMWMGPMLGDVPVSLRADISGNKLYAVITIDGFGGVDVVFGEGTYQIKNSGFENFHTATAGSATSDEPNAWHSFMSCTGIFASMVSSTPHTFISEDVRPGSTGSKSVAVVSGIVMPGFLNIPANGTMTTGQMKAGAMVATDTGNCAFLDFENEELDANGDPFYTVIEGRPDSLAVWVKFKQGVLAEENADYKYASISAILTNGGYYQDPGDSIATNVVAKAANTQIESKDFTWQRISIPFDYASYVANNAEARALLVTITTNAQPGVGSTDAANLDSIYVDDIELIYNNNLTALNIKGTDIALEAGKADYELTGVSGELSLDDITAEADGQGAIINTTVESVEGGVLVTVKVVSNDYLKTNTYTVNVKGVTTGIGKAETTTVNGVKAIYTIDGRRVSSMDAKGVYVVRKTDGTTVKVMNR